FGYRQELKRSLSLIDLVVYGIVFMVPAACLVFFGVVFNASRGMVPLVYVVGVVAMLFTAGSYVVMSRIYPVAGPVYAYSAHTLGDTVGFLAGWALLLDYLLLPTLVYVTMAIAMHSVVPEIPKSVWIVGFMAINTVANLRGIETTARMSLVFLIVQLTLLAVFVVVAIGAIAAGRPGAHFSSAPFFRPERFSLSLLFGALSLAVLSFLGFDAISTMSEEASGGASSVGRATLISLVVTAALFVGLTYV